MDAGFKTVESIMFSTRKLLVSVKGMSEQKIDKIIDAGKFYKLFVLSLNQIVLQFSNIICF